MFFGHFNFDFNSYTPQHQHQHQSEKPVVPPAGKSYMDNLPKVKITADDLVEVTNKECLICLVEQELGGTAVKLPCGHIYHEDCIKGWLKRSCTCPVCRYEVPTDDASYEKDRTSRMKNRKLRCRRDELENMSISKLRSLMASLSVSSSGCVDKVDLVDRLVRSGKIELTEGVPPTILTVEDFDKKTVGELKAMMKAIGKSSDGMMEKWELKKGLLDSGRVILSDTTMSNEEMSSPSRGVVCPDSSLSASVINHDTIGGDGCDGEVSSNSRFNCETGMEFGENDVNNTAAAAVDDDDFVHVDKVKDMEDDCSIINDSELMETCLKQTTPKVNSSISCSDSSNSSSCVTPRGDTSYNLNVVDNSISDRRFEINRNGGRLSEKSRTSPNSRSPGPASSIELTFSFLQSMSIKELKSFMSDMSISANGCFCKEDLFDAIEKSGKIVILRE